MGRWAGLGARQWAGELAYYGLWAMVLILAFVLQVVPVLLVVAMFGLAVGGPRGAELIAVPLIVLAMILVACVIATRGVGRRRAPPGRGGGGTRVPLQWSAIVGEFRRHR